MATKKSIKKPAEKAKGAKSDVKKKAVKKMTMRAKPAGAKEHAGKKKLKCCSHCPDFTKCDDKGTCCDYCDFYLNARCTFGKKKGIPSLNQQIELPDYRGDDYGIDDYDAYEAVYE